MTSLALTTHILAHLRKNKGFEVSRACFVAAAAQSGEDGATTREIAERIGEKPPDIGGQLLRFQEADILRQIPRTAPIRYVPTEKGLAILAPLIPIKRKPAAAAP